MKNLTSKSAQGSLTIRDVAAKAHVGVTTVSRVLNSSTHVSPDTQARIVQAMKDLQFRPHAGARMLRQRAEMICFLLSNRDFLQPFHARILQGVETNASRIKRPVVFAVLHYQPETRQDRIPLPPVLKERGITAGVILAGTAYPNLIRRIQSLSIPFVAFGNNVITEPENRNFDEVSYDGEKAEFDATRYLIDCGHRCIAFVGDTAFPWFREQHVGFLRAMRLNGLAPASLTNQQLGTLVEYGDTAVPAILEMSPRVSAVLAGSDDIAYGLWRSLRRCGLRVPDDMSLIGFDDTDPALLIDPPLTTIRVPKERIGQDCLELLLQRLRRPEFACAKLSLNAELVIRGTVRTL